MPRHQGSNCSEYRLLPQQDKQDGGTEYDQCASCVHVRLPGLVEGLLRSQIFVLFNKHTDEQFQHISESASSRDQEDPFDHMQVMRLGKCYGGSFSGLMDAGCDGFMKQCLAGISVEHRNTADSHQSKEK